MLRESIITDRNIYSAAHRWAYANGWSTTGAIVAVALLSYPFALGPAVALLGISILLALFTLWTEALESGLQSLMDLPDSVNASRHNMPENNFKDLYIDMSDMFLIDLPLNFNPATIIASAVFDTPFGAVGATGGNA